MPAPLEIIQSLESVVDIYFSSVRHRERAAFILCDNLVEMACKTKAKQHDHKFDTTCNFHIAINAKGVQLPMRTLGAKVKGYRDTRNNMQHGSAAATVDTSYCSASILTAVEIIDRLWNNTSQQLPSWMRVAFRVIKLYSDNGVEVKRRPFEDKMREMRWRGFSREHVLITEVTIEPGHRDYWQIAIRTQSQLVEQCLNELGIL